MTRADAIPGAANVIKVTDRHAWVYLRICVPREVDSLSGLAPQGGVPLPTLKLYEHGKSVAEAVEPCPVKAPAPPQAYYPVRSMNKLADIRATMQLWLPDGFDLNQASDHDEVPADDRIWFAPPWNRPMLLMPNPDNKYLVAIPGPYQEDRIIVIRSRLLSVTEKGGAKADMRYWSFCNTDFELPVASVGCLYDVSRPAWLPVPIAWMPWGEWQYPKWFFHRHMIPVGSGAECGSEDLFPYAIQEAVAGCWRGKLACNHPDAVIDFTLHNLPPQADFTNAGCSAQKIMGDYYRVAVWRGKSAFERGGWRACSASSSRSRSSSITLRWPLRYRRCRARCPY